MEKFLELDKKDIETLLQEYETEIIEHKSRLISLMIEKDSIRRKICDLEQEKDILELVKSGVDFKEHLVNIVN